MARRRRMTRDAKKQQVTPKNYGRFSGNPKTEWLTDAAAPDRDMKLAKDFWYEDPNGKRWSAPAGSIINGASIPKPLWSVVGSPYTDDYRCASLVHDVACNDPTGDRAEADRMFYFACLAGGCSESQARLLYLGVRIGAWSSAISSWEGLNRSALLYRTPPQVSVAEVSMLATFHELAAEAAALPPDAPFEKLESLVNKRLQVRADR